MERNKLEQYRKSYHPKYQDVVKYNDDIMTSIRKARETAETNFLCMCKKSKVVIYLKEP